MRLPGASDRRGNALILLFVGLFLLIIGFLTRQSGEILTLLHWQNQILRELKNRDVAPGSGAVSLSVPVRELLPLPPAPPPELNQGGSEYGE